MSAKERERDPSIEVEVVDDVIGIASELERAEHERIDVDEMKEIAAELRIDPKFVEPALARLERDRAEAGAARERARRKRRELVVRVLGALLALLTAGVSAVMWTRATLGAAWADVERARAQVESVRARQAHVEAFFRDRAEGREREAELTGAENRVAIERRRYDEAAAGYNAQASGLPSSLFCGIAGVPCRAPTSSEVPGW